MSEKDPAYPVFLRIEGKRALVVGGGPVGERKLKGLVESGASCVVVSPKVTPGIEAIIGDRVEWRSRTFEPADLDGVAIAVAATDSQRVNAEVVEAAHTRGVLVNDATSLDRSDFTLPATVRRGGMTLAVSTEGGSPAYAKLVRTMLEDAFGGEHAAMVELLSELRPRVMERFPDGGDRKAFWDRLVTEETLGMIKQNEMEAVRNRVEQWLSS